MAVLQPTLLKFHSESVRCGDKLYLKSCQCGSRVAKLNCKTIQVLESNFFVVNVGVKFLLKEGCKPTVCPTYKLQLVNVTTNEVLREVTVWPCTLTELIWEGVLEANTRLGFKFIPSSCFKADCLSLIGSINIDQHRYNQIVQLAQDTLFDKNRKIESISQPPPQAFPPAPLYPPQYPPGLVLPWPNIAIPWKANQQIPAGQIPQTAFPNGDYYDKFQSVQYSVFFFLGIDMNTIAPDSPDLTIFIKNFQDRGDSNYLKKVYMSALRCELMPNYTPKIDAFLNEVYTAITVNRKPVLSAFKNSNILFFLAMHIGYDDYPDYVLEYFRLFSDIIGFGDPDRVGRDAAMIYGNTFSPKVKQYFAERTTKIIAEGDATTLIYHWHKAGLPEDSILIEAVHNMVAFTQYANTLYKEIADKIWATNPAYPFPAFPPPQPTEVGGIPYWYPVPPIPKLPLVGPPAACGPVNFFAKMTAAVTEEQKVDVIREVYRLLSPNSNAFSKHVNSDGTEDPPTQSRHFWQQMMIYNQVPDAGSYGSKVIKYFQYNPSMYAAYPANFRCPVMAPIPPLDNYNPEDLFEISTTDNTLSNDGTVIEKNFGNPIDGNNLYPNLIPVFPSPVYPEFGLGYRRCAGEVLNNFLGIKMTEKFAGLNWSVEPLPWPPAYNTFVTLAPFSAVPDNIFVDM